MKGVASSCYRLAASGTPGQSSDTRPVSRHQASLQTPSQSSMVTSEARPEAWQECREWWGQGSTGRMEAPRHAAKQDRNAALHGDIPGQL